MHREEPVIPPLETAPLIAATASDSDEEISSPENSIAIPIVLSPSSASAAVVNDLSFRKRCMIGGLGALMPILLNLIIIDLKTVFLGIDVISTLTYGVRVVALFAVGAVTAWLYEDERNARKLFQLGIAGPALLTAFINGINVDSHRQIGKNEEGIGFSIFVTPAYAQQQQDSALSLNRMRPLTTREKILRGLLGRDERGPWFVGLSTIYPTLEEAANEAKRLQDTLDLDTKVYAHGEQYLVVLGDWIEQDDARRIFSQAAEKGLSVKTWVYTQPPSASL